jgi:hypothetical protein
LETLRNPHFSVAILYGIFASFVRRVLNDDEQAQQSEMVEWQKGLELGLGADRDRGGSAY